MKRYCLQICRPAALGLVFLVMPLAQAGTIGIKDGSLIVGTEPGDGDQVIQASISGTDLLISGVTFDIVTPGCSGQAKVLCALSGFTDLILLGGDGDDVVDLSAIGAPPPFGTLILGGRGNDILIGSGGNDAIYGGPGDDVLIGGPGQDCLFPGTGGDVVIQAATFCSEVEPVITPLPRPLVAPEPGALWLLAPALGTLAALKRRIIVGRRK